MTAHAAIIYLNYQKMKHCCVRITAILLTASFEVACSIWKNVSCSEIYAFTPFVCHFFGSASGLFVSLLLLNHSNYRNNIRFILPFLIVFCIFCSVLCISPVLSSNWISLADARV
uniref:Uncharacterized protein n=1 Tax=Romanomermis culicivorax TaxID=13658 RepID=A0A915KWQ4_ROMCU